MTRIRRIGTDQIRVNSSNPVPSVVYSLGSDPINTDFGHYPHIPHDLASAER